LSVLVALFLASCLSSAFFLYVGARAVGLYWVTKKQVVLTLLGLSVVSVVCMTIALLASTSINALEKALRAATAAQGPIPGNDRVRGVLPHFR
jgi:hypothetical protein